MPVKKILTKRAKMHLRKPTIKLIRHRLAKKIHSNRILSQILKTAQQNSIENPTDPGSVSEHYLLPDKTTSDKKVSPKNRTLQPPKCF